MNEFDLIQSLCRGLASNDAVTVGPGDDCAVLDLGVPGTRILFKTDAVVEGIHFTRDTSPERIGHKALARCLSDIAAMAGTPVAALVTLGLPADFDPAFVARMYQGMNQLARRHQVAIAGGETTTNPDRIFVSIALLGTVPADRTVLRTGARCGDAIFVSGELGGSLAGHHLDFEPRLAEARWLAASFPIHSMIDLSDGLAGDLRHLVSGQKLGADLLRRAIPIRREAKVRAANALSTKAPLMAALTDGEDFELLFTLAPSAAVALLDGWRKKFPAVKLSCIGRVTPEPGLRLRDNDTVQTLDAHGYVHFEKS